MTLQIPPDNVYVDSGRGLVLLNVTDADWALTAVVLEIDRKTFNMVVEGKGWAGEHQELALRPAVEHLALLEIKNALPGAETVRLVGLKRLRTPTGRRKSATD